MLTIIASHKGAKGFEPSQDFFDSLVIDCGLIAAQKLAEEMSQDIAYGSSKIYTKYVDMAYNEGLDVDQIEWDEMIDDWIKKDTKYDIYDISNHKVIYSK